MNIKRVLKHFRRERAFRLINGRLAGPKCFRKKLYLLRKAGYEIGDGTKIVGPLFVSTNLKIGKNCWIGRNFSCEGDGLVVIGNNCDIAPNVVISTGGHQIGGPERRAGVGLTTNVTVGEGCWICNSALIFADVNRSSVVAAGAVVINEVKENRLVAGVPAIEKKVL